MRITELVQKLLAALVEHGDVRVYCTDESWIAPVLKVDADAEQEGKPIVVIEGGN